MRKASSRSFVSFTLVLVLSTCLGGCGGISEHDDGDVIARIDAGPDVRLRPFEPDAGQQSDADAAVAHLDRDGSSFDAYREDACPYVPPPPPDMMCDPLGPNECREGSSCYPFPPQGTDPCNPGPYTMKCAASGSGGQGAECGSGSFCQPGHVCAVTAQGNQCLKLCKPGTIDACSNGLVCARLDVPGLGGCL